MARFWKERLDTTRHTDFMATSHVGGVLVEAPPDNLIERPVYFVSVCGFTFQFQSLAQIEECLAHFSKLVHPSSMISGVTLEHHWQSWDQRLPRYLFEKSKRRRVVNALRRALQEFR